MKIKMEKKKREAEEDGRVRREKEELARDLCTESPHARITVPALKKLASTSLILFSEATLERWV